MFNVHKVVVVRIHLCTLPGCLMFTRWRVVVVRIHLCTLPECLMFTWWRVVVVRIHLCTLPGCLMFTSGGQHPLGRDTLVYPPRMFNVHKVEGGSGQDTLVYPPRMFNVHMVEGSILLVGIHLCTLPGCLMFTRWRAASSWSGYTCVTRLSVQ